MKSDRYRYDGSQSSVRHSVNTYYVLGKLCHAQIYGAITIRPLKRKMSERIERRVCQSYQKLRISVYVEPAYSKWVMTKGGDNQLA